MTDHTPMQLEKYYTCYIESRLHIPYNPASARLTTGLLIECPNSTQDNTILMMVLEAKALTSILTEQKFISDCRYRVIESSSLVPVLFREVFSHPYISFFHLLVNGFLLYIYMLSVCLSYVKLTA